jgi:hypothetical protein
MNVDILAPNTPWLLTHCSAPFNDMTDLTQRSAYEFKFGLLTG